MHKKVLLLRICSEVLAKPLTRIRKSSTIYALTLHFPRCCNKTARFRYKNWCVSIILCTECRLWRHSQLSADNRLQRYNIFCKSARKMQKNALFLLQRAHKLTRISRYSCVSGAKVVHFADIQKGFFRLVRKVL